MAMLPGRLGRSDRPPALQAAEGNRVQLLHDGEQCLPAMLAAIEGAQHEVLLEMYWFGSDATGRRFAIALADKARAGVRVCVTYDSAGSWDSERSMFDELRAAGATVIEYNPLRFWRVRWRLNNRRNHRKLLIIDGELGMTGGVNLGDPWAPLVDGGHGFHDDMVRIEGPAVAKMRDVFVASWHAVPKQRVRLAESTVPAAVGSTTVVVLANERERKSRRLIERVYLDVLKRAQRRVLIENSYFIPNRLVRHALTKAAARGVDVRVILPRESDVPAVDFAARKLYGHLMAHGIRIFEWSQSVLHSKTAVIDDWCTVGTHNLDYRSWLYNLEINVAIDDPQIAAALALRIQRDLARSVEVDAHTWKFRPLSNRLLEYFFYLFRRLL